MASILSSPWCLNLEELKKELEKRNLNAFSDFRKKIDYTENNPENTQKLLMVDPLNLVLARKEKEHVPAR